MTIPRTIEPSDIAAIIDTREKNPLNLSPLQSVSGTLCTGDYSLAGLEHVVRIERKSLPDLIGWIGRERPRFDREVQRLLAFHVRILLIESSWEQIEMHDDCPAWRGKVTSQAVIGSLLGWQATGLSIHMVGDHQRAGKHAARILFTVARRRYRELMCLVANAADESESRAETLTGGAGE